MTSAPGAGEGLGPPIKKIEQIQKPSPWTNSPFGTLSDWVDSVAPPVDFTPPLPTPAAKKELAATVDSFTPLLSNLKIAHDEREARREAITEGALTVRINKELLRAEPAIKRDRTSIYDKGPSAAQQESDDELKSCLERMARLPERLEFKPGITLVVGENGAGKSTLARALHYSVRHQDSVEMFGKESADQMRKPNQTLEHYLKTQNDRDRGFNSSDIEYYQAGLSPQISEAIDIEILHQGLDGLLQHYFDATELMGLRRPNDYLRSDGDYRSHRQTVDDDLWGSLKRVKVDDTKRGTARPGVYFIDEPETGMSPKRHHNIQAEILDAVIDKSVVICPTNSIVLFDSDLPRIDLDFPERGVHRPSDYAAGAAGV